MALATMIKDDEAQAAIAFLTGVLQGTVDGHAKGISIRMRAAHDIVRFWQTQERYSPVRIAELAQSPKASADVRDYANLSDEDLQARVVQIIDFSRNNAGA